VRIDTAADGRPQIVFSVRDTGIGIPLVKQAQIFEPFIQEDCSTTRRFGGTGLGLSISRKLIDAMGGSLWLESSPGEGSAFHFTLPLTIPRQAEAEAQPSAALLARRALIVDDHPTNRLILERSLVHLGMEVISVADHHAALAALHEAAAAAAAVDVVLLDSSMPDCSGFTLARNIIAASGLPRPALILLSSAGSKGDAAQCREIGIDGYLTRPVVQDEIRQTLQRLVAGRPRPGSAAAPLVTRHVLAEDGPALNILLAEPHPLSQKLIFGMLSRLGHDVSVVASAAAWREVLDEQSFDLAILSPLLPELDSLLPDLRRHHPELALIGVAAGEAESQRCSAAGIGKILAKPVQTSAMREALTAERRGGDPGTPAANPLRFDYARALLAADHEIVDQIGAQLLAQLPQEQAKLQEAVAAADQERTLRGAHALQGLLDAVGAAPAAEILEAIAQQALSADPAALATLMNELDVELRALGEALRAH
jgi:CheY-like chemotaxis protein